jgi:hypothetical protein
LLALPWLEKHIRRNMKALAEPREVIPVQLPLAAQHLCNNAARSEYIHQILLLELVLFHEESHYL